MAVEIPPWGPAFAGGGRGDLGAGGDGLAAGGGEECLDFSSPRRDRGLPGWRRECRREALEAVTKLDSLPERRGEDFLGIPLAEDFFDVGQRYL